MSLYQHILSLSLSPCQTSMQRLYLNLWIIIPDLLVLKYFPINLVISFARQVTKEIGDQQLSVSIQLLYNQTLVS